MAKKPTKKKLEPKRKLDSLSDRIEDVKETTRERYRINNPPTSPTSIADNAVTKRKKKSQKKGLFAWIAENL